LHPASPRELRGYFRKPYGPGWVLAGDAGLHVHPASANGIVVALRSAELVHETVERAWADNQPAAAYLDDYQRIREAESLDPYSLSYRMGDINHAADPDFLAHIRGVRLK